MCILNGRDIGRTSTSNFILVARPYHVIFPPCVDRMCGVWDSAYFLPKLIYIVMRMLVLINLFVGGAIHVIFSAIVFMIDAVLYLSPWSKRL